ncbi:MAG: cupin domain-containing protein, partial [Aquabacterium sp.]|nr:cupin domain-containing protein [Ferruginibacter sp.]
GTENIEAKIIGYTPQAITAIVWIKDFAPQEVHDDEFEKFLIVEGSCTITVGQEVTELFPGDFFAIPLYKKHVVKVTSAVACKIILQRIAA